jgi:hypothetical protein
VKIKTGIYRVNQTSIAAQIKTLLIHKPPSLLTYQSGGLFNETFRNMYIANTVVTVAELTPTHTKVTFSGILYRLTGEAAPPLVSTNITITDSTSYFPVR